MAFDPYAVLPRFADAYRAAHAGTDPYTAVWPWAEAIVRWHQTQNPSLLPEGDQRTREHLVAAVAESLRIAMGWTGLTIGDLDLNRLGAELRSWSEDEDESGVGLTPGGNGWPAPTGPYADRWHALVHVFASDPEQWAWVLRRVDHAFTCLLQHARSAPHLVGNSYNAVLDYRLRQAPGLKGDYRSLAEVAPSLEMSPVPVRDPRWYEGYLVVTLPEAGCGED
ncbi:MULTISPECIES: hypothetical protein [unclassified Streptomyces]|uniref:hypothetical protein n=1 Tax=unclassified Streptomyces TaxID=2593676 RepID=UPI0036269F13